MKSPFPGMDPYLERHWLDVHQRFCTYAADQLQEQLGNDLIARIGERLVVESMLDEPRAIYPDVRVFEQGIAGTEWTPSDATGGVAIAEPVVVQVGSDPIAQGFIDIIDPDSNTLITAIEFLSPTNKLRGNGRDQYIRKQHQLYSTAVSFVEIDLVRAGQRTFLLPEIQFPPKLKAEYFACIWRGGLWDRFELYPLPLRKNLPGIRIPLRRHERDVVLDLQALIDKAYKNGRYSRLDYKKPCEPPLNAEDAAWAEGLLKDSGRS